MSKAFIPTNAKCFGSDALNAEGAVIIYGNAVDTLQYKGKPIMLFKHIEGDSAIKAKGYTGAFLALTTFKHEYDAVVYDFIWESMNVMADLTSVQDLFLMPNEKWHVISRCNETEFVKLGCYSDYRAFIQDYKGTPKEDPQEATAEKSIASEGASEGTETAPKDTEGTPDKATHYKGAVEPLEVMSKLMTKDEFIGFLKGNIIKYSYRAGRKDGESGEKDRNKFLVYSDWLHKVTNGEPIVLGDKEITIK